MKLFVVNAQSISAGSIHSLAICNNNEVQAWGYNEHGELGNGTINGQFYLPGHVNGLSGIIAVAGGTYHSLALQNNGTVWAWGRNSTSGALGNGTLADTSFPVKVLSLTNVNAIAAGEFHSLALKNDSTVWGWGVGNANGTGTTSTVRVQVSSLSGIVAIAAKGYNSLALKSDGTVWAWGENDNGQLGDSTTTPSVSPLKVRHLDNVIAVAAGVRHSLALKSDGTVWAWGNNDYGALGDSTNTESHFPVQVKHLTGVTAIAGGGSIWGDPNLFGFSLAIKNDGTVWAWGAGALGNGTFSASNVPIQVFSLTDIIEISAGGGHALARQNDGTLWSWGYNSRGQLGNGGIVSSSIPVLVTTACQGLNGVDEIAEQVTLSIYPNPSSGKFQLIFDNSQTHKGELEIYNLFGEKIYTASSINQQIENQIDLSALSKGIYFLKLSDVTHVITKRIVIQ